MDRTLRDDPEAPPRYGAVAVVAIGETGDDVPIELAADVPRAGASAACLVAVALALACAAAAAAAPPSVRPHVVLLTVDTLRADRLSAYGYAKPTTPALDRLLASGVQFDDARTVEPLTGPALVSLFTSLEPDVHGASRNAVPMRQGLDSLATHLRRAGYRSAAFVSSWVLRRGWTGLARHFDSYREVLTRKRWFGLVGAEAGAGEVNAAVARWLERLGLEAARQPFLLWVHYVDPHAPYQTKRRFAARLGVPRFRPPASARYDTEVAYVDEQIGALVELLSRPTVFGPNTLFVLASDHGESLGEHGYWGHGRNLHEESVRIPMGIAWADRLAPRRVAAPASILDITPTVLGLLGIEAPGLSGFDWSPVFAGAPVGERVLWLQAHAGVALGGGRAAERRKRGLLELGTVARGRKQSWRLAERRLLTFDLWRDRRELVNLTGDATTPPPFLQDRLQRVVAHLESTEDRPVELDDESVTALRALGYLP